MIEYVNSYRIFNRAGQDFEAFLIGYSGKQSGKMAITREGEFIKVADHEVKNSKGYPIEDHTIFLKMKAFEEVLRKMVIDSGEMERNIGKIREMLSKVFEYDSVIDINVAEKYMNDALDSKWRRHGYKAKFISCQYQTEIADKLVISKEFEIDGKLKVFVNKAKMVGYTKEKVQATAEFELLSNDIMINQGRFDIKDFNNLYIDDVIEYHVWNSFYHAIIMEKPLAFTKKSVLEYTNEVMRKIEFRGRTK